MYEKPTQLNDIQMLSVEPRLERLLSRLRATSNACYVTTASALPSLFSQAEQHLPVLFIASKRVQALSMVGPDMGPPQICLDGCSAGYDSSSYLTWSGRDFSIAIDNDDLYAFYLAAYNAHKSIVVWVGDSAMKSAYLTVDDQLLDLVESAERARQIPRFVPGRDCIEHRLSKFPALISSDEIQLIGPDDKPLYVARALEDAEEAV